VCSGGTSTKPLHAKVIDETFCSYNIKILFQWYNNFIFSFCEANNDGKSITLQLSQCYLLFLMKL
jgi:hypothetical protein